MVLSSTDQATMDATRREIGQITEGEKALLTRLTRAAVEFHLTQQAPMESCDIKPGTSVT